MDAEKLYENFQKYSKLLKKYFPEKGTDVFLEEFGLRLTTAPRGMTEPEGGVQGALVEHLLSVTLKANEHSKILETAGTTEDLNRKSVARVCLVHELGKLGSLEEELFVVQESQWHRDKLGQRFKYNENCPKMSVSHRTLCILQKYGMEISQEEWIAILTSQGMHFPENAFYSNCLSSTAKLLHFARSIA